MFKTENVEELVELVLLSGALKDEIPLSLMLVAKPENAKTSIIQSFTCDHTILTSDISPKLLSSVVVPRILNDGIHHIVIPDLIRPLSHRTSTVDSTVLFFCGIMEEGIQNNLYFGQEFSLPRKIHCGLITSVTTSFFRQVFKKWNDIGFTSRFLCCAYLYSDETTSQIHARIQTGIKMHDAKSVTTPKDKAVIAISEEIASYISVQAQDLAKRINTFTVKVTTQGGHSQIIHPEINGFRLHRQLRTLVKCIAFRDGRTEATWQDVEKFKMVLPFINMPNAAKII